MVRRLILVLAAVALVAGCGGDEEALTPGERVDVAAFNVDVSSTALDSSGYGDLLESKEAMIALVREKPDAVYETSEGESRTLRQVLADAASTLGAYRPELADEFDRVLANLD